MFSHRPLHASTNIGNARWEHDPAWAITSQLLISKHQQVQLLEAASGVVSSLYQKMDKTRELIRRDVVFTASLYM
jgi:superfamily II RNA helicase